MFHPFAVASADQLAAKAQLFVKSLAYTIQELYTDNLFETGLPYARLQASSIDGETQNPRAGYG